MKAIMTEKAMYLSSGNFAIEEAMNLSRANIENENAFYVYRADKTCFDIPVREVGGRNFELFSQIKEISGYTEKTSSYNKGMKYFSHGNVVP